MDVAMWMGRAIAYDMVIGVLAALWYGSALSYNWLRGPR